MTTLPPDLELLIKHKDEKFEECCHGPASVAVLSDYVNNKFSAAVQIMQERVEGVGIDYFLAESDALREIIEEREQQNARLVEALEKIAEDFGTDYCDGKTMIAHEALSTPSGTAE